MEINKYRNEITQLINNIKEHSDYLSDFERIPQLELEMVLSKIRKLYERTIILNHVYEREMLKKREDQEAKRNFAKENAPAPEPAAPEEKSSSQDMMEALFPPSEPVAEENAGRAGEEKTETEGTDKEKVLKEDKPEEKLPGAMPQEENLVVDDPEKKLPERGPGESIKEEPVEEKQPDRRHPEDLLTEVKAPVSSGEKKEGVIKEELNARFSESAGTGSLNERIGRNKLYASLSSRLQKQPVSDLGKAIGINERFLYTKELFGNNSSSFTDAVNKLNSFNNFAEAEHYLFENLAQGYNWDLESENVKNFVELVQRRYL